MRMTMMSNNNNNNNNNAGNGRNFGDSEFTKVFVGGLAWETQKETMREHFEKYGEILEAVIISDKVTGRSKGYGFVTFKEPDAAKKACEESCPIINGRRANCNLAALGAKQHRRPAAAAHTNSMPPPSPLHGNVGPRATSVALANHVHWPYHPAGTPASAPASPFHHQHYHAVPFYGYSPTYIATGMYNNTYNQKVNYGGGWNGHFTQVYPAQTAAAIVGGNSTMMPVYPFYNQHFHQTMGLPTHIYSPTTQGPIQSLPALISKPTPIPPNTGTVGTATTEALRIN